MVTLSCFGIWAHALLLQSTPAQNATVSGPKQHFVLHFNSRIDAARSHLSISGAKGTSRALPVVEGHNGGELTTDADGLTPGAYRLQWQVLAIDGHLTRGEIPFTVK